MCNYELVVDILQELERIRGLLVRNGKQIQAKSVIWIEPLLSKAKTRIFN